MVRMLAKKEGRASRIFDPGFVVAGECFPTLHDLVLFDGMSLFANNVKEVKLDATLDKKKLPPGTYLANIVAEGKTSRIVFTIAAPDAKPKVDFSKILGFLKKKGGGE